MSDRTNRDAGQKKHRKQFRRLCGCWLCLDGKTKLREKQQAVLRKQLLDLASGRK